MVDIIFWKAKYFGTEKTINFEKKYIIVRASVHYLTNYTSSPMAIASRSFFPRQRGCTSREHALARTFFTTVLARTVFIQINLKKINYCSILSTSIVPNFK